MVIEFAGLPGAGKTTICNHVSVPHRTRNSIPLSEIRAQPSFLAVVWNVLLLCLSARPFKLRRLVRGINLVAVLRCYGQAAQPVILDLGLLHKIWSIVLDSETYSEAHLHHLMANLKSFAPSYLVWVETPLETAAQRIAQRPRGKSRFDRLPPSEINDTLASKAQLLSKLAELYIAHTGAVLVRLDGQAPPEINARKIDDLLARQNQTE